MNTLSASQDPLVLNHEPFFFVQERRAGAAIYANSDRSRYLRIGDERTTARELAFHQQLLSSGFPVAQILDTGLHEGRRYWIEESLGNTPFGIRFGEEMAQNGSVSDASFQQFLEIVQRMHRAQERILKHETADVANLRRTLAVDDLILELPTEAIRIEDGFRRAVDALQTWPSCLTHGDFLPFNILERGVIDFGDHFLGPIGYDMVNAITTSYWFPDEEGFEYTRLSTFSDTQIDTYLATVATYRIGDKTYDIMKIFDALMLLRGIWWTVRNDEIPKLQAWRYTRFLKLLAKLEQGESLYEYWRMSESY